MDRETRRLVEEFRRDEASPIENNLIDELVAGELDRQDFLRRAAVFGLGAGTVGLLFKYLGEPELASVVDAGNIGRLEFRRTRRATRTAWFHLSRSSASGGPTSGLAPNR